MRKRRRRRITPTARANFLADKSAGKLVAVAFYEEEAALEGSAETVKPMRTEVAEAMNGKVVGFDSYELVAQSWLRALLGGAGPWESLHRRER